MSIYQKIFTHIIDNTIFGQSRFFTLIHNKETVKFENWTLAVVDTFANVIDSELIDDDDLLDYENDNLWLYEVIFAISLNGEKLFDIKTEFQVIENGEFTREDLLNADWTITPNDQTSITSSQLMHELMKII